MKARLEHALHAAWRRKGLFSQIMLPLSWVYADIVASRRKNYLRRPERIHHDTLPVVVVGNLYVGGTGKTPVVIALVQALQQKGWRPGVVSRGYGTRPADKPRVGQGRLDPALFGDEPALIAEQTQVPIAVHPDRPAAISRLRRQHPDIDVVISDDGLQHLAMGRDLEIIVQDVRGIGNGRLLPAGPLREPAARLQSVDFIINNLLPGEASPTPFSGVTRMMDMTMEPASVEHLASGKRLGWTDWLARHGDEKCMAAAAIGRPERFFYMLRNHGLTLTQSLGLPDHFRYERSPFNDSDANHILITPKDAVKCRRLNDPRLHCVHPAPRFSDPGWLDLVHELLQAISDRKAASHK